MPQYTHQSTSNTVPRCTLPHPKKAKTTRALVKQTRAWFEDDDRANKRYPPTSRQCFSIRRDRATFSPTSVHAGDVSWILARSALTLRTRPPVEVDPILMSRSSFLTSLETLVCFLSSVFTPRRRRRRNRLISSSIILTT